MGMCIRVQSTSSRFFQAGLITAVLLLVMAFPAAAQDVADEEPMTGSEHWSPYTAPTEFDPDANVYIIVRGDCLWNLAARFYSDPLLWPQIWDANRYIEDAHWIYPGDPLVIPEAPAVGAQRMVGGEEEFGDEPMPDEAVDELGGEPVPPEEIVDPEIDGLIFSSETPGSVVNLVDIYCAPMIVPDLDRYEHTVVGAEEMDKVSQGPGDVIYLDCGENDGVAAGDRFFVHHQFDKVKHPDSRQGLGWAMRQVGELEVLCANENDATAMIGRCCAEVQVGDLLVPWEELPIPVVEPTVPLERCDEMTGGMEGFLVHSLEAQAAMATGDLMVIDKGSDDGVGPGDFFSIYRYQQGHRLMLGEAVVVFTERNTATVKLIASVRAIYVGDSIDLK